MKINKYSVTILSMICSLYCLSCGSRTIDITPPTLEASSYTPIPVIDEICGTEQPVVFQLTGGDQLSFDVLFSDDVALSQYKIDIHNNFDCHGHGGGTAPSISVPNVDNQTIDWSILDIENLSGKSAQIMRTFDVPENVTTGNYHFQIQVIDESGNDIPSDNVFALKINNPLDNVAPQITVDQPASNSFTVQKGQTINFSGQVTDDRSLSDGGNGVLYLAYTDLSSGNTFATNEIFAFDENIDKNFDFNFDYQVPLTLVAGSYRLSLGANDGVRNVAPFQFFNVEITN